MVDTDSGHIVSNPIRNKLHDYQLPNLFLFITGINHRSMILAWLMMQAQWLQSLVNIDSAPQMPTPQHWHNFLSNFTKKMCLLPMFPSMSKVAHGGVQKNKGKDQSVTKGSNRHSSPVQRLSAVILMWFIGVTWQSCKGKTIPASPQTSYHRSFGTHLNRISVIKFASLTAISCLLPGHPFLKPACTWT